MSINTIDIDFFCGGKELEAIKARVKEMEEEAEKLKEMQKQVEESIMSPTAGQPSCKKLSYTSHGCHAHPLVKKRFGQNCEKCVFRVMI